MKRFILAVVGTFGDVEPFVGTGRKLRERGHEVFVVAPRGYEPLIRGAGLEFVSPGTEELLQPMAQEADLFDREKAMERLARIAWMHMEPLIRITRELHAPARTVLAASAMMTTGMRLAGELTGAPMAIVQFAPFSFTPAAMESAARARSPEAEQRIAALREGLGLPPLSTPLNAWALGAQRVLGMYPRWYAPELALPPHVRLTGFPLFDGPGALPDEVDGWLNEGEPPLVVTFGTGMHHADKLFATTIEACGRGGRRVLALARDSAQLPSPLPSHARHFPFVPFGRILTRVAGLVHHGGIGTTSHAMRAALPQLVVPFAHDQPDNASRVAAMGVGGTIEPPSFSVDAAEAMLDRLLSSAEVRERCAEVAKRMEGVDGLDEAASVLEGMELASEGSSTSAGAGAESARG
jgi:UDP:flavonoid glycosyltransferase YjiC (YdhE family)